MTCPAWRELCAAVHTATYAAHAGSFADVATLAEAGDVIALQLRELHPDTDNAEPARYAITGGRTVPANSATVAARWTTFARAVTAAGSDLAWTATTSDERGHPRPPAVSLARAVVTAWHLTTR